MITFNKKINGITFLFRHFVFTSIPVFLIFYFSLSQAEPMKWVVVLPAGYLILVNDYNRLFTMFKQPLPLFVINILLSVACGVFPIKLFWLSILGVLFRIIMAFNITNLSKNLNNEI